MTTWIDTNMGPAEFIVEFIKAYATFLTAIAWPLVILVIFITVMLYVERTFGVLFRKRRMALNWRAYENVIDQLEAGYADSLARLKNNHSRKQLVQQQIIRARESIQQRDSKRALRSLAALSALGVQTDKQVAQLQVGETADAAELLPPGPDES
ncbi:hypothetical protein K8I31_15425 [bacterium]|nr:hypothetical protein [bacterium]